MTDKTHITEHDFTLFQRDLMAPADLVNFLEHISSCDYCAQEFAVHMNKEIISAPRDLKANIMKATKKQEIQIYQRVKETSKSMQLFFYSLKVGMATLCALLLLAMTVNITPSSLSSPPEFVAESIEQNPDTNNHLTTTIMESMSILSSSIQKFSTNIMNSEVTNYDQ